MGLFAGHLWLRWVKRPVMDWRRSRSVMAGGKSCTLLMLIVLLWRKCWSSRDLWAPRVTWSHVAPLLLAGVICHLLSWLGLLVRLASPDLLVGPRKGSS